MPSSQKRPKRAIPGAESDANLQCLPVELLYMIFGDYEFFDLLRLCFVCRRLRSVIENEAAFSRRLFRMRLGEASMSKKKARMAKEAVARLYLHSSSGKSSGGGGHCESIPGRGNSETGVSKPGPPVTNTR